MPELRYGPSGPPVPEEPVAVTWNETLDEGNIASISPHIDSPFFLSFGDINALPASGSIRASAAFQVASAIGVAITAGNPTFVAPGAGEIRCLGTADVLFQTTGGGIAISAVAVPTSNPPAGQIIIESSQSINISSASSSIQLTAPTIDITGTSNLNLISGGTYAITTSNAFPIVFSTNGVQRLTIEANGNWNVGGDPGTLGQLLQSNGAALPPTWTGPVSITLSIVVPAVAAGAVGYVDTTVVGTALENIVGLNGGVAIDPQSDLVAAGAGGGLLNARMSAVNTLRTAFVGPLAGGAANFTVTKVR